MSFTLANNVVVNEQADLKTVPTAVLVATYNKITARPVAKFADRATAERRTWLALTTAEPVPPTTTITETTDMATKTAPRKRTTRNGAITEKKIYKLAKENPRRAGTWGFKSFAKIRDGMTVEQYLAAGGRRNDLAWDLAHKYVELR